MSRIFAIDPGPEKSAWVTWDGYQILEKEKSENLHILQNVIPEIRADAMVIEQVTSYGMPVGASVFETVFWSGRFYEAWENSQSGKIYKIPRTTVKMHLCPNTRAKGSNIRQAINDIYEHDLLPRQSP